MAMGIKAEFIIHGYSINKRDCMISTPNQRIALEKSNLARYGNYAKWMDQVVSEDSSAGIGGAQTIYKFKQFTCVVNAEDIWDTKGLKESDGNCTDITFINNKGFCNDPKITPSVKYSRLTLAQKSDPKCKEVDFNIMEDLFNKGAVISIAPSTPVQ